MLEDIRKRLDEALDHLREEAQLKTPAECAWKILSWND
jgi:hypothetical protein